MCGAFVKESKFNQIYSWISIVLNSIVPFSVLLTLNCLIIQTVKNRGNFLQKDEPKLNTEQSANSDEKLRERQLIIMLLMVTFALLLLTMPQYIRYTIYVFVDYKKAHDLHANYILTYNLTSKLLFTNHAVNFYMYCLGGSKFRHDLRRVFVCNK